MLTYNNNHIFTGYLKELLANDPLPNYNIYTSDTETYPSYVFSTKPVSAGSNSTEHHCWYNPYLKDGKLQYYCWNGNLDKPEYEWKEVAEALNIPVTNRTSFYANNRELNSCKTLVIKNNVHDAETHKYLGEYLRHKRDAEGLDLMPLYNCFTDDICLKAKFEFSINIGKNQASAGQEGKDLTKTKKIYISPVNDQNYYKLYKIPVKLFKKYTIAMDSVHGAEVICGFFDQYQVDANDLENFYALTYVKYNSLKFNSPVVYDRLAVGTTTWDGSNDDNINKPYKELLNLSGKTVLLEEKQHQSYIGMLNNLTLFIKVPIDVNSSIVVLEGDFRGFNNNIWSPRSKPKLKTIDIEATSISSSTTYTNIQATKASGAEYTYGGIQTQINTPGSTISRASNHWVTNYDIFDPESPLVRENLSLNQNFKPITNLQLLELNDLKSHPYADRLIEYLTENAINNTEKEIPENVLRVKKIILQNRTLIKVNEGKYTAATWKLDYPNLGVWENKMQRIIYDYMQTNNAENKQQDFQATRDCLGFIDKDAEANYTSFTPKQKNGEYIDEYQRISALGALE